MVAAVVAFGWWLAGNLQENTSASGIPLTLDYLDQPANFPIFGSSFRTTQSVEDALIVGFWNTIRVAVVGIIAATVIGTLVGIARLSTNWLLAKAAKAYVELLRNVPLLVLVVFSYLAVFLRAPRPEDATSVDGLLHFSVRGVRVPWYRTEGSGWVVLALLVVAVVAGVLVARWRRSVFERTGRPAWSAVAGFATSVVVVAVGMVALDGPVDVTAPQVGEAGRPSGGIVMQPEYAALLAALALYTSSHIAEIVRGSIQAVPKGQTEAATALGLSPAKRMRLVVLPQAMRIAVPAFGNQYLNLTKNSSLAVAISYFELTKVTQLTVSNASPAVPAYGLLLFVYLAISLALSAVVNVVNRRLAVVER